MALSNDRSRWTAVIQRDARADSRFVYAVMTTGVFCRPSCSARRPRRENVRFFHDAETARAAGFRPCKRCRPTAPEVATDEAAWLARACARLRGDEPAETRAVARELAMNEFTFVRQFKRHLGVTPQQYRRRARSERARDALTQAPSVTAAVYDAGYSSSSRFYEDVGRELGMTPRRAREGAAGTRLRYAVRRTSLGALLVAWTERGVADVRFGSARAELEAGLRATFPKATLDARARAPEWLARIVDAVERPRAIDVPLDVQGTAFQERVWRALRAIPVGETTTYTALARALGSPSAARAVARACAQNRLAVVVPCHRVVRATGELAGYRWGVERKRELLRRERARR